jgi:hypothetical protein
MRPSVRGFETFASDYEGVSKGVVSLFECERTLHWVELSLVLISFLLITFRPVQLNVLLWFEVSAD